MICYFAIINITPFQVHFQSFANTKNSIFRVEPNYFQLVCHFRICSKNSRLQDDAVNCPVASPVQVSPTVCSNGFPHVELGLGRLVQQQRLSHVAFDQPVYPDVAGPELQRDCHHQVYHIFRLSFKDNPLFCHVY